MSEKDNVDGSGEGTGSFNRRSFVKALGVAGGASVFGAVGTGSVGATSADTVSTEDREATQEKVEHALRAKKIRTLLDETGNPTVQRESARELILRGKEVTIRIIVLPTQVGDIRYLKKDDGNDEASLSFGRSTFEDQKANIPLEKQRQMSSPYRDLPEDFKAVINVGEDKQPIFSRLATSGEQDVLAEMTGVSPDDLQASINTRTGVFMVRDTGGRVVQEQTVDPHTNAPAFNEVTKKEFEDATVESPVITPQVSDCFQYASRCAASGARCAICVPACVTPISCAACLILSCGFGAYACNKFRKNCL